MLLNATGGGTAPTNPKFVKAFQNHMFYAGATNSQEVIFSVPFEEDNFTTASGAGSFKVDSEVVGLKVFRNELIIFCEDRIYKLTGTTSSILQYKKLLEILDVEMVVVFRNWW